MTDRILDLDCNEDWAKQLRERDIPRQTNPRRSHDGTPRTIKT
ncbi:MAG: hypothetical protein VB858_05750 [Planctomycetaceae bacterium]